MSEMLVAYGPCGCRMMALLDASDEEQADQFDADCIDNGWDMRREDHETISAKRCEAHGGEAGYGRPLR